MFSMRLNAVFCAAFCALLVCVYLQFGFAANDREGVRPPDWVTTLISQTNAVQSPASATILELLNETHLEFRKPTRAEMHVRLAFRIIKPEKAPALARVLEEVSPHREVNDLEGWLIGSNGSATELGKEDQIRINLSTGQGSYQDADVQIAGFKSVKPNDVEAFEYEVKEEDWESMYHEFQVHNREPVCHFSLEVMTPDEWQLLSSLNLPAGIVAAHTDPRIWTWTADSLPYIKDETHTPEGDATIQSISIVGVPPADDRKEYDFGTWRSTARYVSSILGVQSGKEDTTVGRTTARLMVNAHTRLDTVKALAGFVQGQIRYVAVEIGKGRFQPRLPEVTLANRFGDCKDKSVLLCEMLKDAGIEAVPACALVKRTLRPDLANPFQFNHCIVAVKADSAMAALYPLAAASGWILFDPTSDVFPFGTLPFQLHGSRVLLARDADPALLTIPAISPANAVARYSADLHLERDGAYTGHLVICYSGEWGYDASYPSLSTDKVKEVLRKRIGQQMPDAVISNFTRRNANDSSVYAFDVKGTGYIAKAGTFALFKADPFRSSETSDLTDATRVLPLCFAPTEELYTDVRWNCGAGITPDLTEERAADSCDVALISGVTRLLPGNVVQHSSYQRYLDSILPPTAYADVRRVWEKRCAVVSEHIILK